MKFFFLLYFSRSGSTFYANSLSRCAAKTVVMPELRFVELLTRLGNERLAACSVAEIQSLLAIDPRWARLELPNLSSVIEKHKQLGVRRVVEAVCCAYAKSQGIKNPKLVVIKSGTALWMFPKIKCYFPDAGVLHISRDPRGVIASLWNSPAAFRNRTSMSARGPVGLSRSWMRYQRRIRALGAHGEHVVSIRYEELCRSHDLVLARVLGQLGTLHDDRRSDATIPLHPAERTIHANVGKQPLNERCLAWRHNLHPWHGCVIESITRQHLDQLFFTPLVSRWQRALAETVYHTRDVFELIYRAGRYPLRKIRSSGLFNSEKTEPRQAEVDAHAVHSRPQQSLLRPNRQLPRI
jgi:hypothetical protein